MSDLDDAIREHLELKRRRGADPAEVAREEQEALAPVTRSHRVVAPEPHEPAPESEVAVTGNGDAHHHDDPAEPAGGEDPGDATQEFRVDLDDWLGADEA